jgi:putative membrane protein
MLELLPLVLTVLAAVGYFVGLTRLHRRGISWPPGRTLALVLACCCVAVGVLPPVADHDEQFPVHVTQHLLLGLTAPALLALSAPATLALWALSLRPRKRLLGVLHSRAVAVLMTIPVAVVLNIGGLYALYLTGLYARTRDNELLHAAVHLHMFIAGCLLSWVIIGRDPIRHRPGFAIRLVALIITGAAHDALAKIMYARDLPIGGGPVADRHAGAMLMYYGGTVIQLAIAVVLMTQWWRATGREIARDQRRSQSYTSSLS